MYTLHNLIYIVMYFIIRLDALEKVLIKERYCSIRELLFVSSKLLASLMLHYLFQS